MTSIITLDETSQAVTIKNLTIEDPTVYKIVNGIKPRSRAEFLRKAVLVGAIGIKNMAIAENVDYVEKEFSKVMHQIELQHNEMETKVKEVFNAKDESSPMGILVKKLAEYFDADSGTIANLLDSNNPESPLNTLREDLITKLEELTRDLAVREQVDEVIGVTPIKGGKFEEQIESVLVRITNAYGDSVECVGDTKGRRGKKGDFVIRVDGDETRKIVVECKDSSGYTHRKVVDELEGAMENRHAQFGIFLFNSADQIPKQMRPTRIAKSAITTSFEGGGLYYAYRIARMVLEHDGTERAEPIPVEDVQEHLTTISEKCSTINTMQAKITQIQNAADYLRRGLGKVQDGVEQCLSQIRTCLS